MWCVSPKLMCDQHILGEHLEVHMFVSHIRERKKIQGYIDNGLLEPHQLTARHNELVKEMVLRGMNHASPLPSYRTTVAGNIDIWNNIFELARRCPECRAKISYHITRWIDAGFPTKDKHHLLVKWIKELDSRDQN